MSDPWRKRCPEGHADIINRTYGYQCGSCERAFVGEPHDAAATDFPVDRDLSSERVVDLVAESLAAPGQWFSVGDIGRIENRVLGPILARAHERGLLEVKRRAARNQWRLSQAGREETGVALPDRTARGQQEVLADD